MTTFETQRTRHDGEDAPRRNPLDWAQGTPAERPPRGFLDRRRWVETKNAFRTTELLVLVAGVVGILVAASLADDLDARYAWTLVTAIAIGYLLSRGIAKSGKGTYVDD